MVNSKEVNQLAESMQVSKHDLMEDHLRYVESDKEDFSKGYYNMTLKTVVHWLMLDTNAEKMLSQR